MDVEYLDDDKKPKLSFLILAVNNHLNAALKRHSMKVSGGSVFMKSTAVLPMLHKNIEINDSRII